MSSALLEAVKNAKNKYSRSDNKHLKPKEGRNAYRIVIPTDPNLLGANGEFWADLGVHWIKTSLKGKPLAVVGSRDVCFGEACEVGFAQAAALEHANTSGYDEDTVNLIKEMRAQKSVLFLAIDRTTDAKAQSVEILEVRPSVAQQIMDQYLQYLDAGSEMFDLKSGVDLIITRTGKGLQTEYSVNVRPGVSQPVSADALRGCVSLREHIEKEYFKGDEKKAIATIEQIVGISVPRLAGPTQTTALPNRASQSAASTSPLNQPEHNQVPDAHVSNDVDTSAIPADDLEDLLNDIDNL